MGNKILNKKYFEVLIVNVILFLLFIILLEIFLWKFNPIENIRQVVSNDYIPSSFLPNQKFTFRSNEGLIGIDSSIEFTLNNVGFRGDDLELQKNSNEFRIFLVGGSTTECLFIDDKKSIESQLQEKLSIHQERGIEVKVFNAGKSGDISTDHLAIISHRINHLEPDLVVLYLGINDLRRTLSNYNYIQFPERKKNKDTVKDFLVAYSQLMRRYVIVKNDAFLNENQIVIQHESNYSELIKKASSLPIIDSIPEFSTRFFENNLKSIVGICEHNDIQLILVTQATTWNTKASKILKNYHWMTATENQMRFNEISLEKGMNRINDEIRKLAKEKRLPILDLERIIPKSEDYFYDDCHFNNNGVAYYGHLLSEIINKHGMVRID